MLRVEDHVGHVDGGLALALGLELLPQLEEAILDLVLHVRIQLLLATDELGLLVLLLLLRWLLRNLLLLLLRVPVGDPRGLGGGQEERPPLPLGPRAVPGVRLLLTTRAVAGEGEARAPHVRDAPGDAHLGTQRLEVACS